jgi:hypothetical protein
MREGEYEVISKSDHHGVAVVLRITHNNNIKHHDVPLLQSSYHSSDAYVFLAEDIL